MMLDRPVAGKARESFGKVLDAEDTKRKLIALEDALYIRHDRRNAFQAFVGAHLRQAVRSSSETPTDLKRGSDKLCRLLRAATVSFIKKHGPLLWPQEQNDDSHLQRSSQIFRKSWKRRADPSPFQFERPECAVHATMDDIHRRAWFKKHPNANPTPADDVINSQLGRIVKEYLLALHELDLEKEAHHGEDTSEETLLNAIIKGHTNDEVNEGGQQSESDSLVADNGSLGVDPLEGFSATLEELELLDSDGWLTDVEGLDWERDEAQEEQWMEMLDETA